MGTPEFSIKFTRTLIVQCRIIYAKLYCNSNNLNIQNRNNTIIPCLQSRVTNFAKENNLQEMMVSYLSINLK